MTADQTLTVRPVRQLGEFLTAGAGVLALVALVAFAVAPAGWRFGLWYYTVAFAIMRYAAYVALAAVAFSVAALAGWPRLARWRRVAALAALAIATVVVYVPWHYAQLAAATPPIHDITTDTVNPPPFWAVLPSRAEENANAVEYGGPAVAKLQHVYYPQIAPVTTTLL